MYFKKSQIEKQTILMTYYRTFGNPKWRVYFSGCLHYTGKIIYTGELINSLIDLKEYSAGIYFIQFFDKSKEINFTKKVLLTK